MPPVLKYDRSPHAEFRPGLSVLPFEAITEAPSPRWETELFEGQWQTPLLQALPHALAGADWIFQDERLNWALQEVGDIEGFRCLQLGAREGLYACALERAGVASLRVIEPEPKEYLKALIAKNLLRLGKTQIELGNYWKDMEASTACYDLIVAFANLDEAGDASKVLNRLCHSTNYLVLSTPYQASDNEERYPEGLSREAILSGIERAGFRRITVGFDNDNNPANSASVIVAVR